MEATATPGMRLEDVVQLWRNAEFVELKNAVLIPALAKLRHDVDSGRVEESHREIADTLASQNIENVLVTSNIYNSINSFEHAVRIFENAVKPEQRTLSLFGKFYKVVADEDNYIDGVSQLRDDQLVKRLNQMMKQDKPASSYVVDESFMPSTGMRPELIQALGSNDYAAAIPHLLELSRFIRAGYENIARRLLHLGSRIKDNVKDADFRKSVYKAEFSGGSVALAFIDAVHYFKLFSEIIQGKIDGVENDPRMKISRDTYRFKVMKVAKYFD